MAIVTRRQFIASAPVALGGLPMLSACSQGADPESYETVAAQTWRLGPTRGFEGEALSRELVRYATLAPSSHNTQCWRFAIVGPTITILPDLSRACQVVDPDDHHVFVSLGCATENLAQAALAHGFRAEAVFDAKRDAVQITLVPTQALMSPLFQAIALRQSTRGDYDGKALSGQELTLLERAGSSDRVRVLMLTERAAMERLLEQVLQGNSAQMADPAFITELKTWVRFNEAGALKTKDGLFGVASGNPPVPSWLGELAFGWVFRPKEENDKYARQVRSSAGVAVFVGQRADKAHWVEVGRCYERFALQATALEVRNALLNQPLEVVAIRPQFAASLGLAGQRPDLVVRFGRGPRLPVSLRRPVQSVLA